jgi:protein-disulfide isomerase
MITPIRAVAVLSVAVVLACRGSDAAQRSEPGARTEGSAAPASAVAAKSPTTSKAPTDSISEKADHGRIRGNPKATMWIVEASDFQCPYCKMWHDSTYGPLVRDYVATGKAQLAYLNYPLSQHQNSLPAAEAAMCASVQNKFWPMHDSLFSSQERWETLPDATPAFDTMAAHIGVNLPSWRDCTSKHLTRALIQADYERTRSAGVKSTPTFFVGEQIVSGFQPYSFFRQVVEAQLAKGSARQ